MVLGYEIGLIHRVLSLIPGQVCVCGFFYSQIEPFISTKNRSWDCEECQALMEFGAHAQLFSLIIPSLGGIAIRSVSAATSPLPR
jgi:hypothetical protein